MPDYIVRETFTTMRFIEADSPEAAKAEAEKGGLLDFDEIDHGAPVTMTVEIDKDMERQRAQERHDDIYSTNMLSNEIQHFKDAAVARMRSALMQMAANAIVRTAQDIAPNAADFKEAIHEDGPDGDHALIVVEDEIAKIFERNPELIAVMRASGEWDEQVRQSDESRAALALVNESIATAEDVWQVDRAAAPTP